MTSSAVSTAVSAASSTASAISSAFSPTCSATSPTSWGTNDEKDEEAKSVASAEVAAAPIISHERSIVYALSVKILNFYNTSMIPKRQLTAGEGVDNHGFDNAQNDYILRAHDTIYSPEGQEFLILDMLGKGTFGQVVLCENVTKKERVAIKVLKNKRNYRNQGVVEIKILHMLNTFDPNGEMHLVKMLDYFVFREHLCIVFELLSASLFDMLKKNHFTGVSMNLSHILVSQICEALCVAREAKIIHCDLKPENILLCNPKRSAIKIVDFGSSCQLGQRIYQYIQSRFYRSPEVLLGIPYDLAIDMWSLG